MSLSEGGSAPVRPGGVTAAGVLLIVLGGLTLLVNGIVFAIAASEDEVLGLESGPLLLGLTGFGIVLGLTAIASGIGVLNRKPAWRIVGLVTAAIGALSALINIVGGAGVGIAVILLLAWVWTIVNLARAGAAFRPAAPAPIEGMAPTMAVGAAGGTGRLGAGLALAGAGLVVVAWFVPVVGTFRLLAPDAPFEFWFWQFLIPLGIVVVGGLAAALGLASPTRAKAGILVGTGTIGFTTFLANLWFALLFEDFGLGSLIGLVGTGLLGAGGLAMAAGSPEPAMSRQPAGPILALVGAVMVLVAWLAPIMTGIGLHVLAEPRFWVETLEAPAVIIAATIAAIPAFGTGRRLAGGVLLGVGILGCLYFLQILGFDLSAERFSAFPIVGLLGAGAVLAGGAVSAVSGIRPSAFPASPTISPGLPSPSPPPTSPPPAPPPREPPSV